MRCPLDAAELELRSVEGHSGYRCVSCSGAWLPSKFVRSIEFSRRFSVAAFEAILTENSSTSEIKCPHQCGDLRSSSKDAFSLNYCPSCNGVWFPKGQLASLLSRHERLDTAGRDMTLEVIGGSALGALLGLLS